MSVETTFQACPAILRQIRSEMAMVVEEVVGILLSLVPYLNAGTLTLIIDLGFERFGFKIRRREFKRAPLKSLFWALCLVFISGIVAIVIQTRLSGIQPFLVFIALLVVYLAMTQLL